MTVSKESLDESKLKVGYDSNGDQEYGYMEFDLSNLPEMDNTVISDAYIDVEANKVNALNELRFHIEMIVPCIGEKTYEKVMRRDIIERIGYDVSVEDIKDRQKQRFVFDKHAIEEMLKHADKNSKAVYSFLADQISTGLLLRPLSTTCAL